MDESDKVVEKSKTKAAKPTFSRHSSPQMGQQPKSRIVPYHENAPARLTDVISYQVLDDVAVYYFMDTYVGIDSINSQFNYLPNLYKRDVSTHSTIRETIKAVGIAGYAMAARQPDVIPTATKSYISAIREVNAALSHPELRLQDSTLASILLLALFEMLVIIRNKRSTNLTNHLNGALSVAALHLKQRTQSDFSIKIMQSICQAVAMNCWIQNIQLPSELAPIRQHLARATADRPPDFQAEFLELVLVLIHSRNAIEKASRCSPRAIITEATKLDHRLRQFMDDLPVEGRFTSIRGTPNTDLAFNGYYHIYPRNFTAHFWNDIRSARMNLHAMIAKQCLLIRNSSDLDVALDDRFATQLELSKKEVNVIATEVCATVPQLAGYLDQLRLSSPSYLNHQYSENDIAGTTAKSSTLDVGSLHPSPRSSTTPDPSHSTLPKRPGPRRYYYHLLYQLRKLAATPDLREDICRWLENRTQWIESMTDQDDKALLKTMLEVTPPSGAFPFFVNK